MVTLKEIAKAAGVSPATVSNVINARPSRVSPQKAGEINELIRTMGYIPNSSARSLARKSSGIIAGVIAGAQDDLLLRDPYNTEFFGALIDIVQDKGYHLMLRSVKCHEDIIHSLRSWSADGAIIVGIPDGHIKKLTQELQIPLIFTDSYTNSRRVSNIGIDDYRGGALAAEYFIKNGHKKLAFAGYPFDSGAKSVVSERFAGFSDTVKKHGLEPFAAYKVSNQSADTSVQSTVNRLIAGEEKPTALFVTADKLAYVFLKELRAAGVDVPGELSVIGFDDLSMSGFTNPGLTTVKQDIEKKAGLAAKSLFSQLDEKLPATSVMLDVELVVRESVRNLTDERSRP